ncbi:MAG TPA: FemAB family XrtA/PEP-CTERM system-associated protein [Phycisphaerae bacterium]|nr:FemAB family XrtA/PEP-CTERM system-associated protein [Phycisphaerae bacterium]
MQIRLLDASSETRYAEYVARRADATFFHELGWKRAVERAFGHESWYLTAERDREIVGILPLFQVNSLLAGRLLISVPYATYGGVLTDDSDAAHALFSEAKSIAGRVGARSIEFRSLRAADPSLHTESSHVTFTKALPTRPDEVLGSFPRKARAAARRAAERYALTTQFGPHFLPDVWRLYARSMRRLGSPNYPRKFFEGLLASEPERCVCQLVRCGERPVAGLLTFLHRDTVMPYFAGIDERREIYGLSHYLYAESMRWGVQQGFARYDFGRSRIDNAGAYDFKRLCGFEPQPLEYQTYIAPGRSAPDLAAGSPRWAMARRMWKHLPLAVARPLGGWLARSIPG